MNNNINSWKDDKTEVRYHMMRPDEIVKRREAMPVAWVPLGTLEWHGVHNPVGSDTLQAEGLCTIAARRGGGLVFPPVYMGDVRIDEIIETLPDHKNDKIAEYMGLPVENFGEDKFPNNHDEQTENYHRLLMHILYQCQSLGFKVCVLVAGHYPLINHTKRAIKAFQSAGNDMTAWTFVDYEMVIDKYSYAGDHAAYWETSHMMALYPDRVDLSLLPPKGGDLLGIMLHDGHLPQDSDADFGYKIFEEAADQAIKEVMHRLKNPELYKDDGCLQRDLFE